MCIYNTSTVTIFPRRIHAWWTDPFLLARPRRINPPSHIECGIPATYARCFFFVSSFLSFTQYTHSHTRMKCKFPYFYPIPRGCSRARLFVCEYTHTSTPTSTSTTFTLYLFDNLITYLLLCFFFLMQIPCMYLRRSIVPARCLHRAAAYTSVYNNNIYKYT